MDFIICAMKRDNIKAVVTDGSDRQMIAFSTVFI